MTELDRAHMAPDPVDQFGAWFSDAIAAGEPEPEATALATASAQGRPSVRFVLMRGFDELGWTFYTNSRSRKGLEMAENAWAALAFRWAVVGRQVRVAGPVRRIPDEDSDAYFSSRARESQIGAWASEQSSVLTDRAALLRRYDDFERRFGDGPVERPQWWGGYRIEPDEVEFWQQGPHRLHDRFRYTRRPGGWRLDRLSP